MWGFCLLKGAQRPAKTRFLRVLSRIFIPLINRGTHLLAWFGIRQKKSQAEPILPSVHVP